jgi:hypothetical protein
MQIVITNISAAPIYVSDLFTTIQPGASVTTTRYLSDLSRMASLQNNVNQGNLTLKVSATPNEIGSGTLSPIPPLMVCAEFDSPAAAAAADVMSPTATVSGSVTYTVQKGTTPGVGFLVNPATFAQGARNLVFTGGGTTAQCPTSAVITGFDGGGNAQTETVTLVAGSGTGAKAWSALTSVQFLGGTGTAGTEEIGIGVVLGLAIPPILRTGMTSPYLAYFPEIVDGAVVGPPATGHLDATHNTYTPAAAPNGTHKYAVYYEGAQTPPG